MVNKLQFKNKQINKRHRYLRVLFTLSDTVLKNTFPACSKAACECVYIYFVDEMLDFALKAPPLELDGDEFVGAHSWRLSLGTKLRLLNRESSGT